MAARRPTGLLRALLRLPNHLYRRRLGWLLGHRFLMVSHIGRRSGTAYDTVLEVVEFRRDTGEAIVMSGFGHRPDWLLNIDNGPAAQITIGRRHFIATHRRLALEEASAVFARFERRNRLARPIVNHVLSQLVGWRYRGSDDERERLLRELPLIGFAPRA